MEFRILGPLDIRDGDRTIPVGGGRQRRLLGLLILNANEAVSTDRIVEELWGERAPPTAPKVVQNHVSQLRRVLTNTVLVTEGSGYTLRLEPGSLDLDRFEQLMREGRGALARDDAHAASAMLREALALWRGPPLADFAFDSFAQTEIARLEERRLVALEERIEADLALGLHVDLVAELEALIARYPLRERLRGQLMLALYRSGRQSEALRVYQEARRALVEELGIEPGPALRQLERAVLGQDAGLELSPTVEAADEASDRRQLSGELIGRERELESLLDALEDALSGRGRVLLIGGEPGVGKSRLADELSERARQRGAVVLFGRAWEAGGAPAYWPWVQAIRGYIRDREGGAVRRQLGNGAADLAQMLPELRELFPDIGPPASSDPEGARFRLFDATAFFLRQASAVQPLVLVLDDLHVADTPSLLLLEFLARELLDMRLLVLGAYRDTELEPESPLSATVAELTRRPAAMIRLRGFAASDVSRFIEANHGIGSPRRLAEAIHLETEGNPLFVGEILRLLAAEGRLDEAVEAPAARLGIPPSVREVIGRRLRHLSDECKSVLTLASVLGREFDLDALVRVTEYELDPQIGEVLEEMYATDLHAHLAGLAYHFDAAVPAGDARKAVQYAWRAGDRASALLAYEEAARLYATGIKMLEAHATGDKVGRCELMLRLGDVQARAGDISSAKKTFLRAAEVARDAGTPEQLARAALGYGGRFVWSRAWGDTELVPLLEEALAGLPEEDSELRVRLLTRLAAGPLRDTLPPEPRERMSQDAVDMARRLGNSATLAYALEGRYDANWGPDVLEGRLAIADELLQVARAAGDAERVYAGCDCRFIALLESGDLPAAHRSHEAASDLAYQLRQPAQLWDTAVRRAQLALFEGRFAEAEPAIHEGLELGLPVQSANAQLAFDLQMYALRREQGRLEEVLDMIERAGDAYPAYPVWRSVVIDVFAELERMDDARAALGASAADDYPLYLEMQWLFAMSLLPEVCRYLEDVAAASAIYELLRPYPRRNAVLPPELCRGSVSRGLGILAATAADWNAAAGHFEVALEMNAAMGARPWLAHTQYDYARMLLARGGAGDRDRARDLLSSANALSRQLGMTALAGKVAAEA